MGIPNVVVDRVDDESTRKKGARDGVRIVQGDNIRKKSITKESSVKDIEAIARAMVAAARVVGYRVAAENLEYYLDGKGGEKIMIRRWLRSFKKVTAAERKNQVRFQNEILKMVKESKKIDGKTVGES